MDLELLRAIAKNQRNTCGTRVRSRRTELGLTLAQASELTGGRVRPQTLHKIETGEIEPRDYLKLALAVALVTEVDQLFPNLARSDVVRLLKAAA